MTSVDSDFEKAERDYYALTVEGEEGVARTAIALNTIAEKVAQFVDNPEVAEQIQRELENVWDELDRLNGAVDYFGSMADAIAETAHRFKRQRDQFADDLRAERLQGRLIAARSLANSIQIEGDLDPTLASLLIEFLTGTDIGLLSDSERLHVWETLRTMAAAMDERTVNLVDKLGASYG